MINYTHYSHLRKLPQSSEDVPSSSVVYHVQKYINGSENGFWKWGPLEVGVGLRKGGPPFVFGENFRGIHNVMNENNSTLFRRTTSVVPYG